jgi:hypothetical protein
MATTTQASVSLREGGHEVDRSALPGGVERLVALARAVPERAGARRTLQRPDLLTRVGVGSLSFFVSTADLVTFLGEAIIGARPDHPDEPRRQCAHAHGELRRRRAIRPFPAGGPRQVLQARRVTAMREPILVINAGSSSIKFSVFETMAGRSLSAGAHGQVEGIGTSPHLEVLPMDRLRATAMPAPSPPSTIGSRRMSAARPVLMEWVTVSYMAGPLIRGRC